MLGSKVEHYNNSSTISTKIKTFKISKIKLLNLG